MLVGRFLLIALSLAGCAAIAPAARAQLLSSLFPEGVPGYGTETGVTVQSRVRPQFEPLGIHLDNFMIRPVLGVSAGYDDNIFGGPNRRGAWQIATRPSVLLASERSDAAAGMSLAVDDIRYLDQPSQNRTDAAAFLGTTLLFARDKLTLGVGFLSRHEDRTELDALPSDRPVAFQVENLRLSYTAGFGRLSAVPSFELNRWRFDNTTILGVPVSEAGRDRTTAQAGLTLRYGWMPARDLVLVTRVLDTHYDHPAAAAPSNNSTSWRTLIGIDYDDNSVWRYRLLGGVEYRAPASAAYRPHTAGSAEAEVTWSPSGLTTVRAAVNRGIEDAAQTGLFSYTYTSARLTVDHEYLRNVLFNASATVRQASFSQTGGEQLGLGAGAGVTWLINHHLRLSLTHDFSDVRNWHLPAGSVAGNYTRTLTLLSLRVAL